MGFKATLYKRYSLLFILSVFLVSIAVIKIQREIFLENLRNKATTVASILSAVSIDAIITYDYVVMERYAQEILSNEDLVSVKITRDDGEVLAKAGSFRDSSDKNLLLITYPLKIAGESIGNIEMKFTKKEIDTITLQIILYTLFFVVFVHLAGLIINNRIINSLVISPIEKLVDATKDIKKGNFDINIDLEAEDEFKTLANALNEMSNTISSTLNELIKNQQALETEKNKVEAILNSIADGLFVTDNKEKIITFNDAAENITGYSKKEAIGSSCNVIFKSDLCAKTCALRNLHKLARNTEATLISKKGKEVTVIVSSSIIKDSNGDIIGGVQTFRDITEEKQRQVMMGHAEMLAAIGQMSAGVAHEINNPIGNIVGYSKLLLKNDQLSENISSKLKIIHEQASKAGNIVQNLLDFSRKPKLNKNFVDINKIVENVVNFQSISASKRSIKIITDLDRNCPHILADSLQIEQVIFNIVLNAIQAIGSSGEITLITKYDELFLEIDIIDNGPGIQKENLNDIFSPFFTTKPAGEGTGLGLFLAMKIIKEHNGFLNVESEAGKMTKFIIKLPIEERYA